MVALSLCRVAPSQINILSVIVFPQEPQSLKSRYFFSPFAFQNEIQVSVLHKFAVVSRTVFRGIFKVGVEASPPKKETKHMRIYCNVCVLPFHKR